MIVSAFWFGTFVILMVLSCIAALIGLIGGIITALSEEHPAPLLALLLIFLPMGVGAIANNFAYIDYQDNEITCYTNFFDPNVCYSNIDGSLMCRYNGDIPMTKCGSSDTADKRYDLHHYEED